MNAKTKAAVEETEEEGNEWTDKGLLKHLVFVNPFLAAESDRDEPGSQDRVVNAQNGFGNYLESKLGIEARKMFEQIVNAIVSEMGEHRYFIEGENMIDKKFRMRELSGAWPDLGKIVEWLKAEGIPLRHPDMQGSIEEGEGKVE